MDSNTLNVGLKKEPQIFPSSSLETRATAKVSSGDVKSFEQNDLRLQNDYRLQRRRMPDKLHL